MLNRGGHAGAVRAIGIEGGFLVRVLTIAQRLGNRSGKGAAARGLDADRTGHPCAHRRVIGRGAGIGDLGELFAEFAAGRSVVLIHVADQFLIILDIGDNGHKSMVLGRRADHRRAANINVFDAGVIVGACGDRGFEGIEVDHEKVDRRDPVLGHRLSVARIVAQRQKAAMNFGVERLDAAIHHLGETCDLRDILDLQPRLAQRLGRAAGRQKLDPAGIERLCQIDKSGLVGDRKKGATDGQLFGHGILVSVLICVRRVVFHKIPKDIWRILRLGQRPANAGRI